MVKDIKRIALVRLGSLGDIVHALPVACRLKTVFPRAYLAWVVEAQYRELLEGCKWVDEVIVLNTRNWRSRLFLKSWVESKAAIRQLRAARFELVLELQGLLKSGLAAYLTGTKCRVGFSRKYCREPLSAFFTNEHVTLKEEEKHIIEKNLALVRHLGLETTPWSFGLPASAADVRYVDQFLAEHAPGSGDKLVGINPGASWVTKRWSIERYAQLADRLMGQPQHKVILIWGPGERDLVEAIAAGMRQTPVIACPTSITQLVELIRRCRLFIAGDTGPLHLAAALLVPCVALYGPSDPERNGPYGEGHAIVHHKLECSSCFKRQCSDIKCIEQIEVDEVWKASVSLLEFKEN